MQAHSLFCVLQELLLTSVHTYFCACTKLSRVDAASQSLLWLENLLLISQQEACLHSHNESSQCNLSASI